MTRRQPIRGRRSWISGTRRGGPERRPAGREALRECGILLDLPENDGPVRLRDFFRNDRPVELEAGCGKGAFLVLAAEMFPGVNFVGVDLSMPVALAAASRLARRGLSNAKVICEDAGHLVNRRLEAESLSAVHVFFPDPWPKRRHWKRRIFSVEFLRGIQRTLVPGGVLCFATDFEPYYRVMRSLVDADGSFERLLAYEWRGGAGGITNYEKKYLREGRTSYRASFRKRDPEAIRL